MGDFTHAAQTRWHHYNLSLGAHYRSTPDSLTDQARTDPHTHTHTHECMCVHMHTPNLGDGSFKLCTQHFSTLGISKIYITKGKKKKSFHWCVRATAAPPHPVKFFILGCLCPIYTYSSQASWYMGCERFILWTLFYEKKEEKKRLHIIVMYDIQIDISRVLTCLPRY